MTLGLVDQLELLDPRLAVFAMGAGLVPRPEAIPHDVLEDALRVFLGKISDLDRRQGCALADARYPTPQDLILAEARPARANFNEMELPHMRPGACFENAYALAQSGLYLYTEGFALMCGAAEPFHHAWLTGARGEIEDPTWGPIYEQKRREQPWRDWSGNIVYFGIVVGGEKHRQWTERTGYPNLLYVRNDPIEETLRTWPDAFR